MKLLLPSVVPIDKRLKDCAVCGATPCKQHPDFEYEYPDGKHGMQCDNDLCMECAMHLWRAFKYACPESYGAFARQVLRDYPITRNAVILGEYQDHEVVKQ